MSVGRDAAGDRRGIPPVGPEGVELVRPLNLVFVRHGVTDMTVAMRFSGSGVPGPHLNAAGRVQAAKAADTVYRIGRSTWTDMPWVTRVLASPMNRTQDTGAALGRRMGLKVETEARLKEIDLGDWDGKTAAEIVERHGSTLERWRLGEVAATGGESFHDVGQRTDELLRELAVEHAKISEQGDDVARTYAFATHAVAIKTMVGVSMGVDVRKWNFIWPPPASLTVLQLRVRRNGEIAERHLMCLGAPVE